MLLKLADVKFQMGSKTNEGGATVMATFIICTVYTCGTVVHLFQVLIVVYDLLHLLLLESPD